MRFVRITLIACASLAILCVARFYTSTVSAKSVTVLKNQPCTYWDDQNKGHEGLCGKKKGDSLHAYCIVKNDKDKKAKPLHQIQDGCLAQ